LSVSGSFRDEKQKFDLMMKFEVCGLAGQRVCEM
jgi:hypothetical protein